MAEVQDILIDEDFDLKIENGDFALGESTNQHTELIMLTAPGEWKNSPITGLNILKYIKGPASNLNRFERELRVQLEADGQIVNDIDLSGGFENIVINSEYE